VSLISRLDYWINGFHTRRNPFTNRFFFTNSCRNSRCSCPDYLCQRIGHKLLRFRRITRHYCAVNSFCSIRFKLNRSPFKDRQFVLFFRLQTTMNPCVFRQLIGSIGSKQKCSGIRISYIRTLAVERWGFSPVNQADNVHLG